MMRPLRHLGTLGLITFLPAAMLLPLSSCQNNDLKGTQSADPGAEGSNRQDSKGKSGNNSLGSDNVPEDDGEATIRSPQSKDRAEDLPVPEVAAPKPTPPPSPSPAPNIPPKAPPAPTTSPSTNTAPAVPPPQGPSPTSGNSLEACTPDHPPTVAHVHVAATVFSNMEHGYHVLEEGAIFQIVQNNKVVIAGNATIDAVTNGRPTDGNGAYPGVILRLEATYSAINSSGSGTLFMCQGAIGAPAHQTQCEQLPAMFPRDPGRPVEIRGHQISWTFSGAQAMGLTSAGSVPQVNVQGANVNVSAYHPVFAAAAPGKAFKDFQSPLVLDLNHNGKFDLIDVWNENYTVRFDLEGINKPVRTGWVAPGDGLLALDVDHNGQIDSGRELFGEHTYGQSTPKADAYSFNDGFLALAQFDSNRDGKIDGRDPIFSSLLIWNDLNSDGISQTRELSRLKDHHIQSVSLRAIKVTNHNGKIVENNLIKLLSEYQTEDGKSWGIADVWFKTRRYTDGFIVQEVSGGKKGENL